MADFLTTTHHFHTTLLTAATFQGGQLQAPKSEIISQSLVLVFTLGNSAAFKDVKFPVYYQGNASFHIHWTKSGTVNESGRFVRWRLQYTIFNGFSEDIDIPPTVVEVESEYLDSGTTSNILYRTPDLPIVGAAAGKYLAVRILAITPVGGPALIDDPALWSLDVTWDEFINQP